MCYCVQSRARRSGINEMWLRHMMRHGWPQRCRNGLSTACVPPNFLHFPCGTSAPRCTSGTSKTHAKIWLRTMPCLRVTDSTASCSCCLAPKTCCFSLDRSLWIRGAVQRSAWTTYSAKSIKVFAKFTLQSSLKLTGGLRITVLL